MELVIKILIVKRFRQGNHHNKKHSSVIFVCVAEILTCKLVLLNEKQIRMMIMRICLIHSAKKVLYVNLELM